MVHVGTTSPTYAPGEDHPVWKELITSSSFSPSLSLGAEEECVPWSQAGSEQMDKAEGWGLEQWLSS